MIAKLGFAAGAAVILWVLHRWIGDYPPALPRSRDTTKDLRDVLPLWLVVRRNGWTRTELGLVWRTKSRSVTIFAVAFGVLSGAVPFLTGQAVMGFDPLPAGEFLLLIYTNTFLEEFFHRGVIQSTLERALGRAPAILCGGVLFGLTHVAFDVSRLASSEGWAGVGLAVLLQTMAGWLFGIIYMKTRSLWPGMACHYLVNWLAAILAAVAVWVGRGPL